MSTQMIGAEEVAKALNTSKVYAYKVIRKLNEEMEEKGMLVVKGKVSAARRPSAASRARRRPTHGRLTSFARWRERRI